MAEPAFREDFPEMSAKVLGLSLKRPPRAAHSQHFACERFKYGLAAIRPNSRRQTRRLIHVAEEVETSAYRRCTMQNEMSAWKEPALRAEVSIRWMLVKLIHHRVMDGLKAVHFDPFSSPWVGRQAHDSSVEKTFPGMVRGTADPSAALGMTKGSATLPWRAVAGQKAFHHPGWAAGP